MALDATFSDPVAWYLSRVRVPLGPQITCCVEPAAESFPPHTSPKKGPFCKTPGVYTILRPFLIQTRRFTDLHRLRQSPYRSLRRSFSLSHTLGLGHIRTANHSPGPTQYVSVHNQKNWSALDCRLLCSTHHSLLVSIGLPLTLYVVLQRCPETSSVGGHSSFATKFPPSESWS